MKSKIYGSHVLATVPYGLSATSKPGQCVKINGAWFAITEQRDGEFDIIVRSTSPLLEWQTALLVEGPIGPGFPNAACCHAVLVAGGTGIGVLIHLIKYRFERGLTTDVVFFSRGSTEISELIPVGMCKNIVVRDTMKEGRPEDPLSLLDLPNGSQVFVSGPKSLVDACKLSAQTKNLVCNLNY
jgi:NAD(P)H-flavin reductase